MSTDYKVTFFDKHHNRVNETFFDTTVIVTESGGLILLDNEREPGDPGRVYIAWGPGEWHTVERIGK